ncbi:hypothetical protein PIROE2DRAFT_16089 [Piromyces sp. E2]|nr:hypothetical protein PIROE2DRAFT_16089 [Piromyces sp. E2]|eukprot:OUM58587.1 hypothetical protein PIROE2DRAFT_16089 [Piromyces sp. E2]
MVSLSKSINDRANDYNHKYLNCYLETISRTISVSLVLIDIAMLVYDRVSLNVYLLLAFHILSNVLFFAATFKPKQFLIFQFIVFSVIFLIYSFLNFTIALGLLLTDGYSIMLLRLSLNGCNVFLEAYAIYISIIYYIRLRNVALCDESVSFEDEIEDANVQLIIDTDAEYAFSDEE